MRSVVLATMLLFWAATAVAQSTPENPEIKPTTPGRFTTDDGHRLSWGIGLTLLRVGASRRADEPGRLRNIEAELLTLKLDLGFLLRFDPNRRVWRTTRADGSDLQNVSAVAGILYRHANPIERSRLSLALGFAFLNGAVAVLFTIDIYRGIAVAGADGARAGSTVRTGFMPWALTRTGEFTTENIGLAISFDLGSTLDPLLGSR